MSVMPVRRDDRLRLPVIVSPDAHAEECQVPIVITSPGPGRRSTSLSMPTERSCCTTWSKRLRPPGDRQKTL